MAGIVRGKKWRPPGQENSKWRQQTEHGPASHTIAMGRVGQVTWKKQLLSHEFTLQQQYPKHEHTVTPLHPGAAVVQATAYGLQRCRGGYKSEEAKKVEEEEGGGGCARCS